MKRTRIIGTVLLFLLMNHPALAGTVQIDEALSFSDQGGQTVSIQPGLYEVTPGIEGRLRLTSLPDRQSWIIHAIEGHHAEELTTEFVRIIRGEDGTYHLVLFLPGKQTWDAPGFMGIQSRATLTQPLQAPTMSSPAPTGTLKVPIVQPHALETDRDMIIRILDSLPGVIEQLKLIKNDTAQLQLKIDALAAQIRRPEGPAGWSLQIPPNERWELLLNGQVVLDRETGLTWERSASQQMISYATALDTCRQKRVFVDPTDYGGRSGWRMPTISELQSLLPLTPGHPLRLPPEFALSGGTGIAAWSADIVSPGRAAAVWLTTGRTIDLDTSRSTAPMWCVRGKD